MSTPMELLSPITTRTDSGAGSSASRTAGKSSSNFDQIFENELSRHDQKMLNNRKGDTGNLKSVEKAMLAEIKKKIEENGENGYAQAAGMMGEQEQEVVFILEGEESVATPQMRVDNIAEPPETEIETQIVDDTGKSVNSANSDGTQSAIHAENPETADFKDTLTAKTGATEENKENVAGEQAARMPDIKSEDSQPNSQTDNFKDDGNPRPLENENDNAQVTGQEDKTYASAVNAVKSKAKSETDDKHTEENVSKDTQTTQAPPTPPLNAGIKAEQFVGTQQMAQTASQSAVKPENLFQEMISRVETVQNDTKSVMTIQLNPEFLGKVALEVAVDQTGVHVKINAEDSSVRGMINSQLATLIESLENKGISVSEVEVVYAGANFDNPSGSDEGRQSTGGNAQSSRQGSESKSGVEYYTTITDLMDYYFEAGISSVEYSA